MTQNYAFGYGSLIERESRTRTNPNAVDAIPVIITGIERGWWASGGSYGYHPCFLGARSNPDATCNGVIYPVTEIELQELDYREGLYDRTEVKPTQIQLLNGAEAMPEDSTIWFYSLKPEEAENHKVPTATHPIVQSYVDICLNGCFEIEAMYPLAKAAGYARLFVTATADWSKYWENDRVYPRRPFTHVPRARRIDRLLHEVIPEYFDRVQLQPARWDD